MTEAHRRVGRLFSRASGSCRGSIQWRRLVLRPPIHAFAECRAEDRNTRRRLLLSHRRGPGRQHQCMHHVRVGRWISQLVPAPFWCGNLPIKQHTRTYSYLVPSALFSFQTHLTSSSPLSSVISFWRCRREGLVFASCSI
jgi:hypothetical protein